MGPAPLPSFRPHFFQNWSLCSAFVDPFLHCWADKGAQAHQSQGQGARVSIYYILLYMYSYYVSSTTWQVDIQAAVSSAFTARRARALLGWSRSSITRHASLPVCARFAADICSPSTCPMLKLLLHACEGISISDQQSHISCSSNHSAEFSTETSLACIA